MRAEEMRVAARGLLPEAQVTADEPAYLRQMIRRPKRSPVQAGRGPSAQGPRKPPCQPRSGFISLLATVAALCERRFPPNSRFSAVTDRRYRTYETASRLFASIHFRKPVTPSLSPIRLAAAKRFGEAGWGEGGQGRARGISRFIPRFVLATALEPFQAYYGRSFRWSPRSPSP